jgi:lambda family phage portal protein
LNAASRIILKNDATAGNFLAGLGAARSRENSDSAFKLGRQERAQKRIPVRRNGDSEILSANPLMTDRVRESYLNVPLVKRPTSLFRDLIVGSGIQTFLDPFDWSFGFDLKRRDDSDFLHSLNVSLEMDEKFQDWGETPRWCDVSGKRCLVEIQRLAISDEVLSGDSVVMYGPAPSDSPLPWALLILEKEQIDTTKDRDFGTTGPITDRETAVIHGFVIDRLGRELGVYLYDVHPNGMLRHSRDSEFISSDRYHHIYSSYRPSQHFGATWLHALGQTAIDLDRWQEAELRKAIKQSLLALVHKSATPDLPAFGMDDLEQFATDIIQTAAEVRLGDSPMAMTIGKDEEVEVVEAASPNNNADNFVSMMQHDASAAVDLSYYSMTGQFGQTNYTGFRGASNLEAAQIAPLQYLFAQAFMKPMRQRWNRDAVAFGHIVQLSPDQFVSERSRWENIDCIGPGRFLIEPDGEVSASLSLMRSGLSHLKYEAAKLGKDWKQVLRNIAIVNRASAMVGVVLDFSKGNGGQVENTSTARSKDQSDKQESTK